MAARTFSAEALGLPRFIQQGAANGNDGHMLLGSMVAETGDKQVHVAEFGPERQWVLSEHKIAERPIVPGTTYLEMVRAAFAGHAENNPVSIRQVVFPAPLILNEGESEMCSRSYSAQAKVFLSALPAKLEKTLTPQRNGKNMRAGKSPSPTDPGLKGRVTISRICSWTL